MSNRRIALVLALALALVSGIVTRWTPARSVAAPMLDRASTPIAGAALSPVATPVPPTNTPLPPSPTATPRPLSFGALDHSIVYDDGTQIVLLPPGGRPVGLASISSSPFPFKRPRYAGWQFMYYNNGFYLGDIFGHHSPVVPPLAAGEEVYDAWPSPDGLYIAWQMVTPGTVDGITLNMASSRILITDQTGGNARTLLQQSAGATYGDIPIIYGWRSGHPPTLLVQTSYGTSAMFGLHRGLEEFDPGIGDLVGDYLPPLGEDTLPGGGVLGVSPSGLSLVYSSKDVVLPSGEEPGFPVILNTMSLVGRHGATIDVASAHKDPAGTRLPVPRAYVFSHQAFISPDDTRIAYTRLDILYPKDTIKPYIRPVACLANLDGSSKADFGPDERVVGWSDGHTVVVRRENTRENGLYAVNLTTGTTTRLMLGNNLRVDGIVP